MNHNARMLATALTAALGLAALAAGCSKISPITAPAVQSGSVDLSRYVALGTSLAAGEESDGVAERHQPFSYANQFARAIGNVPFDRYTVDQDGIDPGGTGPMLNLVSLNPLFISTLGHTMGTAGNQALATDYHNLGVPSAVLFDVADSSGYYLPSPFYHSAHFQWVMRHRGRIIDAVARIQPTLITLEYGANEILGPATNGTDNLGPFPVATWSAILHGTLDALHAVAPAAQIVMINTPDPTDTPFCRTFSWITLDDAGAPTPLIGPSGPLAPGSLVLLTAGDSLAAGTGFPTNCHSYVTGVPGNGRPLPGNLILDPTEIGNLQTEVQGYNNAVSTEAAARGWAVVDLHAAFKQTAANGVTVAGQHYNTAFVTGGIFSLDGVHPTDLGYGIIANTLIDVVDGKYGAAIPHVDLATCLTASSYRMSPVTLGHMPYIRNAEEMYARMFPTSARAH
ncbi:MAG: SGNH/GDSL hydrolase family protein [Candidatus Eisenbacteria bacterium]